MTGASRSGAPRDAPGLAALWFGFLAPPTAWFLHLSVSYSLVRYVCFTGSVWTLHATTAVTLALGISGGVVALRSWRRLRSAGDEVDPEGRGYARLLAISGLGLAALFLAIIVAAGVPPFVLGACPS